MGKRSRVTISFDPRVTDVVYLHAEGTEYGFEVCTLHDASRAYSGRTCLEADLDRERMGAGIRDAETRDVTTSINVDKRLEARVASAKARKPEDRHVPKSHRVADIRENRKAEKTRTKTEQGDAFRPAQAELPERGQILPFARLAPDDFSESRLTDFMGD